MVLRVFTKIAQLTENQTGRGNNFRRPVLDTLLLTKLTDACLSNWRAKLPGVSVNRRLPLDFQLLYLVAPVFVVDEKGDHEYFPAGIQRSQSIFHVGPGGLVCDCERPGGIVVEEGLGNLPCLVL